MTIQDLPAINATLNATCACLLIAGYVQIKKKNERAHRNLMIAAVVTSAIFLASYLTYHFSVTAVTKFAGTGWTRPVYFTILITHSILAVIILPMVLRTVWLGIKDRREQHKRLARWTFPLWMYVSVTGVVIYLMLYQLFPVQK